MDSDDDIVKKLIDFLNKAWTPYHAVAEARGLLEAAGFRRLAEGDSWVGTVAPGGSYYFTRGHSTLVAFSVSHRYEAGGPFWVVGAHTDSPCLKIKPVSKASKAGFLCVGVQTYGGGLWHTWFDRDLSLAGRVVVRTRGSDVGGAGTSSSPAPAEGLEHRLVRIERPILRIPTLAIHLDREVNTAGFKPNLQQHLLPIMATSIKEELEKPAPAGQGVTPGADGVEKKPVTAPRHHAVLLKLLAEELRCEPEDICDWDLNVCDVQPSTVGGALGEFIFSGRLDNLCSSFCALQALIDSGTESPGAGEAEGPQGVRVVALFDHEECGSQSAQGAASPVLEEVMRRVTLSLGPPQGAATDLFEQAMKRSFLVSADMAHCLHPNYQEKHEENHQPQLHKGLVIKHNVNQRYATDAVSASLFREIGRLAGIPTQDFVIRNDAACGSTIGPILASRLGIRTVDVGAPQLSMHSVREMCGTDDVRHAHAHFKEFFRLFGSLDASLVVD